VAVIIGLLLIGTVLPDVAAGVQAERINAKLTDKNINTFFIYFLSRVGVAANYKDFPSLQTEQYDAPKYRQYCLCTLQSRIGRFEFKRLLNYRDQFRIRLLAWIVRD